LFLPHPNPSPRGEGLNRRISFSYPLLPREKGAGGIAVNLSFIKIYISLIMKGIATFFPIPLENRVDCCNFAHIKELF